MLAYSHLKTLVPNYLVNYHLLKCSGHLESRAGRYLLEGQFLMVGLVHWYYFSSFVMESGSANPQIQLAQMKCEFNCVPKSLWIPLIPLLET